MNKYLIPLFIVTVLTGVLAFSMQNAATGFLSVTFLVLADLSIIALLLKVFFKEPNPTPLRPLRLRRVRRK